jgi:hypothetical protein
MKYFRIGISVAVLVVFCGFMQGCKKACDDLADVCGSCNRDYRDSCDYEHDICDILKGRAGNECCDALLDGWESRCR